VCQDVRPAHSGRGRRRAGQLGALNGLRTRNEPNSCPSRRSSNQPGLYAALGQHPIAARHVDTGHGRVTTRTIQALPAPRIYRSCT